MMVEKPAKTIAYTRYPGSSVVLYNGVTLLHYLFGGVGITLGYNFSELAYFFGFLYLAFALGQMYILMPLTVCPNCVYYRLKDSRCISGLNTFSRKIAPEGDIKNFAKRGEGLFCHNNLYMVSLVLPLIAMIPALFINFSLLLLVIFLTVMGLFLFRIFVIFPKVACVHCRAKNICPNAKAMGLNQH